MQIFVMGSTPKGEGVPVSSPSPYPLPSRERGEEGRSGRNGEYPISNIKYPIMKDEKQKKQNLASGYYFFRACLRQTRPPTGQCPTLNRES
jgi:hypothetical protein